jgi:RNA polymerase sigma-70 factor (ECF subfamily)
MNPLSDLSPSDVESLISRARAGDTLAWEVLFRKCYPMVVRVVRRKLDRPMRSLFDSTDFASDVMKSFAANLNHLQFESSESLMAFLVQVAQQKVVDEYRKAHTIKRDITRQQSLGHVDEDGPGLSLASDAPTASKIAQADEAHEALVRDQDEPQRAAIELKLKGYTNEEISGEVGWQVRKVQRFFKDLEDRFLRRA